MHYRVIILTIHGEFNIKIRCKLFLGIVKMIFKLSEKTKGVYIIAATPFLDNGSIDLESVDRLIDFYIEKGIDGITILGIMGEAAKLTDDEAVTLMKRILKRVNEKLPVIVGVSNASTDKLVSLSKSAMDLGAAGVMVAPFSAHKTDEAIFNYFSTIANALGSDIPMVYQDYPLTTNADVSVNCLLRIIKEIKQVVMLKHEEWPGLNKLSILRGKSEALGLRRISILSGNGGLFLPQELDRGADGPMTGFSFPEMLVQVYAMHTSGNIDGAEDLFDAYLPLIRHEQQLGYGLAIRKEILRRRGAISSAKTRAPGPTLNAHDHKELDRLLDRLDNKLSALG